jgi:hypothetical protein
MCSSMQAGWLGEVSGDGMGRLCEDIGQEITSTEKWIQRLYFIIVGQTTQEGDMLKAGEQFENHRLVKFPTHIPKLNKEERRKISNVLIHCKAEAQFKLLSSSPKQVPATEEAGPLPKRNVTEVLPSQLDDQLFLDIGRIFFVESKKIKQQSATMSSDG